MRRVILTFFSFSPLGELAAAAGGKLCDYEREGRDHEREGRDHERQGRDHERQGRDHDATMSAKAATMNLSLIHI